MLTEFQRIGRDLFLAGLNSSHSGNLSVRCGDRIVITRRGSMLGHLEERDLIETGLEKNDSNIILASTEIGVHRAIYKRTPALAIVHAHPVHAIALSLLEDEIIPLDSEGAYLLHRVPVIGAEHTIGSRELEEKLPGYLSEYKIAVVRGHGSFAVGQMLEEAYQWTSALENICRIICLTRTLGGELKDRRWVRYKEW
ncbi:MAG: aldolase [Pelotomaculum sp.]|uniref:Ribulose-5-phosphate 4-epimerase and related epimerases and aldolases n=1 Tax=Pelotomaculum thermopropionicum (strain DSM 13744 / JCM 10971 / SI) TaxID=370438 RepID=A5D3S8_PELTS|nr:aldolase [Pelotomaculum sp.]BAF59101.1 ribulose-5-phosphate 4-epimerase and related epimerases and aldolases [Pelotomaculum thermopropionicum SI]